MAEISLSFEEHISPLFRDEDVDAMLFALDLRSYDDVRANGEEIYERLADGSMPCDAEWPEEQIARFRRWLDTGAAP